MKGKFYMPKIILGICGLLLASLVIISCGKDKNPGGGDSPQTTAPRVAANEITYNPKSDPGEPDIDAVLNLDEPPKPTKTVNPTYPEDARKNGIEGMVWVKVLIDKKGLVKRAVVIKRKGTESFEDVTLNAARQWEFKPAVAGKETVDVWVVIPFAFKLDKDKK